MKTPFAIAGVVIAALAGAGAGLWLGRDHPGVLDDARLRAERVLGRRDAAGEAADKAEHGAHDHSAHDQGEQQPAPAAGERKVLYYRNPMGLPDVSPEPKKDEMGMDYIPVYADEEGGGDDLSVRISPERIQRLGVRTEAAALRDLVRPVRAAGTVAFDERRTFVVATRFEGWIERLLVNATGETVRPGQPLMEVYSPELVLAQEELALVLRTGNGGSGRLIEGARLRLDALGFPQDARAALERGEPPRQRVAIPSPYGGTVIEKPAVEGARFMAGEPLYRIVDLSRVWVIAQVFEQDLTSVALGQAAVVRVQAYPDRSFPGRVGFLYPTVGRETRTAQVRIELANPGGALKADMVASVEIAAPVGRRSVLTVPDSAVIDSGARQVVLIEKGEGRFEPRPVRIGARGDGHVQVLDGVASGDRVVVSANFLIDAESNLKAALQAFGADGAAAGHQH